MRLGCYGKGYPVMVHHMDACICRFSMPLTVNTSHPLVRRHILIAVIAEICLSRDLKSWPASSSSNLLGVLACSLSGPGTLNRRQRSTSNFTHLVAASAHASNFRLPGL